ncbi:MAG: hypothetical protein HPY80_13265 [Bacteroidales bacterium]|jgi:hypothetical protein|nr:hypothetical protein [Bacteroidales bacterium]NPV37623.1 hypothetical protein [Bacteroidales bacterium]
MSAYGKTSIKKESVTLSLKHPKGKERVRRAFEKDAQIRKRVNTLLIWVWSRITGFCSVKIAKFMPIKAFEAINGLVWPEYFADTSNMEIKRKNLPPIK